MAGHPVRVRIPELVLRQEGQAPEVVERGEVTTPDVPQMVPVGGVVGDDPGDRPPEPLQLKRLEGFAGAVTFK